MMGGERLRQAAKVEAKGGGGRRQLNSIQYHLYMSNMYVENSLRWRQPQPRCNDIILNPRVPLNPKI